MAAGEDVAAVFGRRLRAFRERLGLTQEQLGSAAGYDYKHVGALERGDKTASFEALEKLAAALGVQVYELFLPDTIDADATADLDRALLLTVRDIERHGSPALKHFLAQTLSSARRLAAGAERA